MPIECVIQTFDIQTFVWYNVNPGNISPVFSKHVLNVMSVLNNVRSGGPGMMEIMPGNGMNLPFQMHARARERERDSSPAPVPNTI